MEAVQSIRCLLTVNGEVRELRVGPRETLLQVLREDLGLKGTRRACEQGECGACTVLLDGEAVDACLVLAASVDGHQVTTIEGLGGEALHRVQQAFLEADASQCGFCTSGMILAAEALLREHPRPTGGEIRSALLGNYCRCTGYQAIAEAVAAAGDARPGLPPGGMRSHVTGETRYLADLSVPGMLFGALVRLPCARAAIREVDGRPALAVPGVVRVFTAQDFLAGGVPRFGSVVADQPILAAAATRYQGEPVALVVAESEAAARAGATAVAVAYDELPAIVTRDQALSADLVHPPESRPPAQARWKDSNVMGAWAFDWGPPGGTDTAAPLVVENTYRVPFAHHFTMEPYGVIAIPEEAGITILSPVQHPFVLRRVIATMLDLPPEKVRIRATDIGGGFGGKGYPKVEPVAAACSRLLGRPLKLTLTAEESFLTGQREAAHIHIRSGFSRDGDLLFHDVSADFLVGAYTDISPAIVSKTSLYALGPYRTRSARVRGRGLFTTTPPTSAFRGFGATHINLAVEGQMNLAAHRLGIDPLALRLRNVLLPGEEMVPGDTPVDGDWGGLLQRLAAAAGWESPRPEGRGRGLAVGLKASSAATSSTARVHLNADGGVVAYVGTTEMGQGARLSMARVVGAALGIPPERVGMVMGDTGVVPFDSWTASSRSTTFMGRALLAACDDVRRRVAALAGEHFGLDSGEAAVDGERVVLGSHAVALGELLREHAPEGVTGEGTFSDSADPGHPLGGRTPFFEVVATAVELHVDADTGRVFVDRITHASDAGKVIDAQRASRVDEGGIVMGMGLALSEQLVYDAAGRLVNGSSLDYRIPTIGDVPEEMAGLFQENGDGPGPWGAKGLGEGGILAVGPAICGAILDLTGAHLTELPVTPERLWRALHSGSGGAATSGAEAGRR
jgi:CO/xanthine dehydrogenase Mo-binding subunit/aerobic-type carbon monoxide dehydrogenase small subunit (CoxS/CutS family)